MTSTITVMTPTVIPMLTVTVVTYTPRMGRWEPNARGRLEQAALELYLDRGFDQTTVAEIASQAGLTERTFFRHFADKREVLFGGGALAEGSPRPWTRRPTPRRRSTP